MNKVCPKIKDSLFSIIIQNLNKGLKTSCPSSLVKFSLNNY